MRHEPNDSSLVRTLKDWYDSMSPEVRMVFDHDESYSSIVEMAAELTNDPADLTGSAAEQAEYARRLGELAGHLDELGGRVSEWQGASRAAFDQTMTDLNERIRSLHEMGTESSRLMQTADQGRAASDHLLSDLVRATIDHAERSLQTARSMSPLTGGMAMSQWTVTNLRQVTLLLEQLAKANERVNTLLADVGQAVADLTESTEELSGELGQIADRLS